MAEACLGQNAAKTAQQIVVVVSRKDLWRKRAKANLNFLDQTYDKEGLSDRDRVSRKNGFRLLQQIDSNYLHRFFGNTRFPQICYLSNCWFIQTYIQANPIKRYADSSS